MQKTLVAILLCPALLTGLVVAAEQTDQKAGTFTQYDISSLEAFEKDLERTYKGKILTLRHFDRRDKIEVRPDGRLKDDPKPGSWTTHGKIEITDIEVHHDRVDFKGRRVWVKWNKKDQVWDHIKTKKKVRARFRFSETGRTAEILEKALLKVFLAPEEELADVAPDYWQPFLRGEFSHLLKLKAESGETDHAEKASTGPNTKEKIRSTIEKIFSSEFTVYWVDKGMPAPRCKKCSAPKYSDAARDIDGGGLVVLYGIISEEGDLKRVAIVEPVGIGLDDEAVRAIHRWEFEPARRKGKPVPTYTAVEINFNLKQ